MVGFDALKTEVIARLGNRTDIDARVERWINYAFFELILYPRFTFFELDRLTTFTTTATTALYNLSAIASDIWHILDVTDLDNSRHLTRSHFQVIDRVVPTSGAPTRYYRFGDNIALDPIPDDTINMQLRYRIRPADQTSGSEFGGLGTEWEEMITVLSVIKGFEALDQRDKASEQRAILEAITALRLDVPTEEDSDAETTIGAVVTDRYM